MLLTPHDPQRFRDATALVPATVVGTAALLRRYWGQQAPARVAAIRAWPLWRAAAPLAAVVAAIIVAAEVLAPRLGLDRATLAWFTVLPTAYALAVLGTHLGLPRGDDR